MNILLSTPVQFNVLKVMFAVNKVSVNTRSPGQRQNENIYVRLEYIVSNTQEQYNQAWTSH